MKNDNQRIVITGIGLTSPLGNNLAELREGLLTGKSGIVHTEIRHMGVVAAGLCKFDETKHQPKKMRKRGTRAGAISIYCTKEALIDSKIDFDGVDKNRVGVYLGITEHGNVETENEIHDLYNTHNKDVSFWSHHHNPRTVANNPAGEVTLNMGITGPHYTIGAACAAGNLGIIQGAQQLLLDEVDLAFAGGVSESTETFGIFAAFKAQGALGHHEDPPLATRPLDKDRNGIVVSEGGAVYVLERLSDAKKRGAHIYAEIVGYHSNSDATDFVLPNTERQIECMQFAMKKAGLEASDIDIVSMHATGTNQGDIQECQAVAQVFGNSKNTYVNATKGFIGHAMGAAGALELAGNIPSFTDGYVHPCKKIENLDPECAIPNLVNGEKVAHDSKYILNNSFGMLGINSSLIVKKFAQ
ncbi:beta-ketoacyl synthase [Bacteriovorax stolpii]|uniref:Beta-ketoacyl synthase n=1 Tax=Bacteriovorax stolpii TaxID=960 RepID=A0A2K9NSR9_BACTC|nr:beta-ketoacyl-[acyl-carrier-protein] synthase family protein [Bacteriovorax stolpii]AUN98135.1 beta-ketoacyl synthase [Bacteriovorax stolpii]TDP52048.1 3-oxoacyl-[acyl-carrier-protein] synthase II [Bacteriovorax stolpii]